MKTMILFCLAVSSFAPLFAAEECAGELVQTTITAGIADEFEEPFEEARPGETMSVLYRGWRMFDERETSSPFGHTFTEIPCGILSATLTIRAMPMDQTGLGATIGLEFIDGFAWQESIRNLSEEWQKPGLPVTITLDLTRLPSGKSLVNILNYINSDRALDVFISHGVAVDYLRLDVTWCQLENDCNGNCIDDKEDIAKGTSQDANKNGIPDECEDCKGVVNDCNNNCIEDEKDIANGTSQDANRNGIPDECECKGVVNDCNNNCIEDRLDIANGTSQDTNGNLIPDECEGDCEGFADCNNNCIPDNEDIANGTSQDTNNNGIPDECEPPPVDPPGIECEVFISLGSGEDCCGVMILSVTVTGTDNYTVTNDFNGTQGEIIEGCFPIGLTQITFTVIDKDTGLSAQCTTTVHVFDTTPPVIRPRN